MTKNTLLIISFILLTYIINAQYNAKIKGKIINNQVLKKVYISKAIDKVLLDSTTIDANGNFKFDLSFSLSNLYILNFDKFTSLLLIIEPNNNIIVELDLKKVSSPKISGSYNSQLLYTTMRKKNEYESKLEKYKKQLLLDKEAYLRKTILNNIGSLTSLFFIGDLDFERNFDLYKKLDESLYKKYQQHPLAQSLHKTVQNNYIIDIGLEAPEIDLPNPDGENIKLSSLRGKYVLIDFWASWCSPCRLESPNLVALYNKYKNKGFEIYSVSLDKSKSSWTKAIVADKLNEWIHVSDLKHWNSSAAKLYKVKGIPYTILLDKDGKIISKGLRAHELKRKLAKIFD